MPKTIRAILVYLFTILATAAYMSVGILFLIYLHPFFRAFGFFHCVGFVILFDTVRLFIYLRNRFKLWH